MKWNNNGIKWIELVFLVRVQDFIIFPPLISSKRVWGLESLNALGTLGALLSETNTRIDGRKKYKKRPLWRKNQGVLCHHNSESSACFEYSESWYFLFKIKKAKKKKIELYAKTLKFWRVKLEVKDWGYMLGRDIRADHCGGKTKGYLAITIPNLLHVLNVLKFAPFGLKLKKKK